MVTENRKALHAYVSDEAHDNWHDFAAEQGVSVSAILQAIAPTLAATTDDLKAESGKISDLLGELVKEARKIDAARRRRSR